MRIDRALRHPGAAAVLVTSLLLGAADTCAQTGIEAAAAAKQAAELAKRQKSTGQATAGSFGRVSAGGSAAGVSPAFAQAPTEGASPARRPRVPSKKRSVVQGSLVDEVEGAPLANLPVRIVTTEPNLEEISHESRSDAGGRFTFTGIVPGSWRLELPPDRVPVTHGAPRRGRPFAVSSQDTLTLAPLRVPRAACVLGHAEWSDGVPLSDGTIHVMPADTSRFSGHTRTDPVGDYELCAAPAGPVMIWLELLDGRRVGERADLAWGQQTRVDFRPRPLDLMDASLLSIQVENPAGQAVPFAQVMLVGRFAQNVDQPHQVFVREISTDRTGGLDLRVPSGHYEVLVFNPREGEWARREQYWVPLNPLNPVPLPVRLAGTSTAEERDAWRAALLERADRMMRLWQP